MGIAAVIVTAPFAKPLRIQMSALGQKRTLKLVSPMSALPPKADIGTGPRYQLRRDNSGSLAMFAAISDYDFKQFILESERGRCLLTKLGLA